jgi:ubiquinone/menaquinone biosynthesis C-methylase UbiE
MKEDKNVKFEGSIPEYYDRHLGPAIFEPYALDLATRVSAVAPTGPVLETSCGTGILTAHLHAKLLNTAHIVASDLNPGMIRIAQKKPGIGSEVEWREADACELPFADRTFAAVVNQFGMMFVPDKGAAIREAERVLKDGGLFAFSVWDSLEQNPLGKIGHETVAKFFESDPPTFYQLPFGFSDPEMWTQLLAASGFGHMEVHKVCFDARSDSAESIAIGLVRGNPIGTAIEERGLPMDKIISAVASKLAQAGGDQPFSCPMQAFVFTARANS